jgi:chromosome segregation ATPase
MKVCVLVLFCGLLQSSEALVNLENPLLDQIIDRKVKELVTETLAEYKDKIGRLEHHALKQYTRINDLKDQVVKQETRNRDLEDRVQKQETRNRDLEDRVQKQETRIRDLENGCEAKKDGPTALQTLKDRKPGTVLKTAHQAYNQKVDDKTSAYGVRQKERIRRGKNTIYIYE